VADDGRGRFEAGLEVRRRVLGAEYVDAALASADEFSRPLQELVTEYAWGSIWTRDGLAPRDRSLITIAMLAGMSRPDELRVHVRGALRNGCTPEEIRETILQAAIYCGVPAAVAAFGIAREVLSANPG
jgi:4-carboxymuconolactone decarboxylase